jgi:thiamine biosynthesis lipoprotein
MSLTAARSRYRAATWRALGTHVSLVVADGEALAGARAACTTLLERIDRACSRFRPDGDLVRANSGAGRWIRVDPLLVRAVEEAVRVAEGTGGTVDPLLGASLAALGYDRDLDAARRLEHLPRRPAAPPGPDAWRAIGTDPAGAVRVPAGLALDLGATGKAFAADLIAAQVPAGCGTSLVISLGGDVAVGSLPGERHRWRVEVSERPGEAGAETVVLTEGAMATSSTVLRRWRRAGETLHHVLDPRTGLPVDPVWRTAAVCAATCVDANAASTAAVVLRDQAPAWLWERELAARLVAADGRVLRVAGWPDRRRTDRRRAETSGVPGGMTARGWSWPR